MKGKLELLLAEGHLANQPEFENLHKNYLSKAEKLKKCRAAADRAQKKFDEKLEQGRMDLLFTLEPKTAFLVAKFRKKIAKAELELERKRIEAWLERFLKNPERAELAKYLDKRLKETRAKPDSQAAEKIEKPEKISQKSSEKLTQKSKPATTAPKKTAEKKPSKKLPPPEKPAKVSKKTN